MVKRPALRYAIFQEHGPRIGGRRFQAALDDRGYGADIDNFTIALPNVVINAIRYSLRSIMPPGSHDTSPQVQDLAHMVLLGSVAGSVILLNS